MKKTITFLIILPLLLTSCQLHSFSKSGEENYYKESSLKKKEAIPKDFFPRDLSVVSAGDSLTKGVGDSTEQGGYVPYLNKLLENERGIRKATFYNFGVRGNRSDQLLQKLQTDEVSQAIKTTDMVILTIGGNDIMKVVRENFTSLKINDFDDQKKRYESNLTSILDTIRSDNPNSMIVLIGLYNPFLKWFSNIKEMNQIIDDWNKDSQLILSQYHHTYFVEIDDIFKKNNDHLLYKDYFHPNNKGYQQIANRIYKNLQGEPLNLLTTNNDLSRINGQ